ncbi:MAG: DUF1178 family protein [Methylocystis sp.]
MILYSLVCAEAHEFDAWFRDSATYDAQASSGVVACPYCQSTKVAKAVVAPHVARKSASRESGETNETRRGDERPDPDRGAATLLDERHAQLRAMIRDLRETLKASTEDVGESFPSEARKIQDGDAEPRPIRGRASLKEAKSLLEEGIEILPFPGLPGEGN